MPMKKRDILPAIKLVLMQALHFQKNVKSLLVVSYNWENLLETIDFPYSGEKKIIR